MKIINKKDNNYDAVKYLQEALSTDETRFVINHLQVEKSIGTATDGMQLRRARLDGFEDGLYKVIKKGKEYILDKVKDVGTYPNFRQVMPDLSKYRKLQMNWNEQSIIYCLQLWHQAKIAIDVKFLESLKQYPFLLNFALVKNLSENEYNDYPIVWVIDREEDVIYRYCVVMPLRSTSVTG